MKFKVIKQKGKIFLIRFSIPMKSGSLKTHVILNDDQDGAHKHPWDFSSFLLFGAYKEIVDGKLIKHFPFTMVKRLCTENHKVILYRVLGIRIPCVTIGFYSKKIQPWCEKEKLCDHCETLGACMDKTYWENLQKNTL
jgi:hypothetical protein